jgi:hypothetical protein
MAHFTDTPTKFYYKAASTVTAYRFSIEFCANPRNVVANRMRGFHFAVFKRVLQIPKGLVFSG